MTRWKMVAVTNDSVVCTVEFNGNMYPKWYWNDIMVSLNACSNLDDFKSMVTGFNTENFNYPEELFYKISRNKFFTDMINFKKDYFEHWFSDRLFIRNFSDGTIKFWLDNWDIYFLDPGETVRFNFWCIEDEED